MKTFIIIGLYQRIIKFMNKSIKINGWNIHHNEKLFYQTNSGNPLIRLKFFHYPTYRQTVLVDKPPIKCQLKSKGYNSFFIFQHKVGTKGFISLDRLVTVIPTISYFDINDNLGAISSFPKALQQKYKQSSKYWPLNSEILQDFSEEKWFETDDLSDWVKSIYYFIKDILKYREKQDKRLGANEAILTRTGDCDEFTDLFITITRMRGIPCRRLTGYFIERKKAIPEAHAWGEILSPIKGWIPIDIALNNIGNHTINYVVLKIEEFNPALPNYQINTIHSSKIHYKWELPEPLITGIK